MPLLAHTHVRYDPLTQTSPNGHISTDMGTDRSVEVIENVAVEQVTFDGWHGTIRSYDRFWIPGGNLSGPKRFVSQGRM